MAPTDKFPSRSHANPHGGFSCHHGAIGFASNTIGAEVFSRHITPSLLEVLFDPEYKLEFLQMELTNCCGFFQGFPLISRSQPVVLALGHSMPAKPPSHRAKALVHAFG